MAHCHTENSGQWREIRKGKWVVDKMVGGKPDESDVAKSK